jgi:NADPH:quinone reductase
MTDIPEYMNSVQLFSKGKVGFGRSPVQKPGPNQVLIKVHSSVINPSDLLFMKGKYNVKPKTYPYTPGWEGSGVVVSAGPGMYG